MMATVESLQVARQMADNITTEMSNAISADATNEEIDILREGRRVIWDEIEEIERNMDLDELRKARLKMMEDGGCYQLTNALLNWVFTVEDALWQKTILEGPCRKGGCGFVCGTGSSLSSLSLSSIRVDW